ncbi:MAG: hypothetical protein JJE04_22360 [Acidobacteriia bacterium]|nr:hypothetical protein [Terriglobia bacterium]
MLPLGQVLFGAAFTLASSYALGRGLLRHSDLPAPIALAAGAALLAQAIFLLLLAGWVNTWTLAFLGAAALTIGHRDVRIKLIPPCMIWILFVPYVGLYTVHALAPEIQPDGYTYHLGLVSEWLRTGSISDRVGFYEMLPQGMEMLFTMAFAYGRHSAAKLIHFAFTLAMIPLMIATAKRLGFDGAPAAAIFFFAPVVGICGASAYNDVALAFYILAVFYVLLEKQEPAMLLLAGVLAGFCYAVKLPGILIAPAVLFYFLIRRQWRGAALFACGAGFMIAPWMLRTAWMSGNPFAPLLNEWFPNPYFHLATQQELTAWLRNYGVAALELPWEVTMRGFRTGGLAGPVFLLVPAALLALRSKPGQLLWLAALLTAIPWWANAGTRFLIPSMVFLALALVVSIPTRLAWVLAAAQAILCWPQFLDLYAAKGAWRLHGFPWQAALRLQDERQYLRANLWEYRIAEMLNAHTKSGDRILDLSAIPAAYVDATGLSPWQSAPADRVMDAVRLAARSDRNIIHNFEYRWRPQPVSAIRVRQSSIQELQMINRGEIIFPSHQWTLQASPNVWEAPLAFDRNLSSGWQTWDPSHRNGSLEVRFPALRQTTGLRVFSRENQTGSAEVLDAHGWHRLLPPHRTDAIPLNLRPAAARLIRREGFGYVLAKISGEGYGPISRDLVYCAGDWGLRRIADVDGVHLLRVK